MSEPEQPEIRELDAKTVERIAAGEVVERPASVVKELIENSIDADASRVTVAVESGGTDSIRVTDDGVGMTEAALRRAVEKHTTSKVGDIEDLEGGVATLGFRGEALHAIGAVSRLRIASRPRDGDRGTELTVAGGEVTDVSPAGCPEGTTVEVWDLFYNVPARRKYLKQEATEFAHVNRVVTSYALANPGVAVTLEHGGRETFATTGQGNLQETVLSVYGREVAENMVEIGDDDLPEGPLAGVSGLVSDPETNRASREYLSTFVNGRYVTAGTVRDAIVDAYGTQLASDRYPFAVVFLEVDPGTIDVNVHPRKLDVRFADEEGVREQVLTAVEETLLSAGFLRSSAPRGRSAPEQTEIQPGSDGPGSRDPETGEPGENGEVTVEHDGRDGAGSESDGRDVAGNNSGGRDGTTTAAGETDAGDRDADSSPDRAETRSGPTITNSTVDADAYPEGDAGSGSPGQERRSGSDTDRQSGEHDRPGRSSESEEESQPSVPGTESPPSAPETEGQPGTSGADSRSSDRGGETTPGSSTGDEGGGRKFRDTGRQQQLGGSRESGVGGGVTLDSLPSMRVLGQLDDTYVVAEADDGLVLVDQHAADERINYERLQAQFEGTTTTQALANPVELELTAGEAAVFDAASDALARLGFHADRVGDRTVRVSTVPAVVADAAGPELIRDVLTDLVADGETAEETVEAVADELLSDLACHPSITGNTSLTDGSVVDLLSTLDDCDNPWACPHGRPVVIHIDSGEIDDRFERDYPGH
jgi:DNA mismatch repair protein MutL